jgi:hypothetical protein
VIVRNLPIFIRLDEAATQIHGVSLHTCSPVTELHRDAAAGTVFVEQAPQRRDRAARMREKEMPPMTESLPSTQRRITAATGTPTRLDRPDVTPVDSAEGRAGAESAVEPVVAEAPILITEQEVRFSTAAAVTVPKKTTAGQRSVMLRLRLLFTRSTADEGAVKHRHYPHHYVFLEQALMAREIERC